MDFEIISKDIICNKTCLPAKNTPNVLTKYERARAIGVRARMISMGDTVYVDTQGMEDEVAMATKELYAGKCPLIIRRFFPNHTKEKPNFEDWNVSDLTLTFM